MKKLFIIAGMVVFFGMQSSTLAGSYDWWWLYKKTTPPLSTLLPTPEPSPPPKPEVDPVQMAYKKIIDALKQQLALTKNLLNQEEKTYASITGDRTTLIEKQNDEKLYLPNPHFIYNKTNHDQVIHNKSLNVQNIERIENIKRFLNNKHAREFINQRLKHAVAIDKAVSLQTFQEAGNRFAAIIKMLKNVEKTQDLKDILEIQAYINGMLAMIRNENIKLQMVTHLRNAEHTLIKQQKRALYLHAFRKNHSGMPTIRFDNNAPS
ncbi:type IV secretion system protein [Bartonella heixiaziensis]|uniref:type IV secretion system protein n=1 Tax=Bartonella heixiaziensis TaxID=1461000 RepID=UPI003D1FC935